MFFFNACRVWFLRPSPVDGPVLALIVTVSDQPALCQSLGVSLRNDSDAENDKGSNFVFLNSCHHILTAKGREGGRREESKRKESWWGSMPDICSRGTSVIQRIGGGNPCAGVTLNAEGRAL